MPRADLTPENVLANTKTPKLRWEQGEKGRIVALAQQPYFEWVHRLEKQQLAGGEPVFETKKTRKEEEYEAPKMEWVSSPICSGDNEVLQKSGIDPDNCKVCAASRTHPEDIRGPQRRWALTVFQYNCAPGSNKPAVPFSGKLVVWNFNDKKFNELVDIVEDFGPLREHDISIVCTNGQYQNVEMQALPNAIWAQDEASKTFVTTMWKEQQFSDSVLRDTCGRTVEDRFLVEDIEGVIARADHVRKFEAMKSGNPQADTLLESAGTADVASALDDLLGSAGSSDAEPPPSVELEEPSTQEEEASASSEAEASSPAPSPVVEEPPAPTGEKISVASLDDLLD